MPASIDSEYPSVSHTGFYKCDEADYKQYILFFGRWESAFLCCLKPESIVFNHTFSQFKVHRVWHFPFPSKNLLLFWSITNWHCQWSGTEIRRKNCYQHLFRRRNRRIFTYRNLRGISPWHLSASCSWRQAGYHTQVHWSVPGWDLTYKNASP